MWTKNIDEHAFLSLQCKRTDVPKFLFALNDKKWMRLLFLGRNPCHTGNCERKKIYMATQHISTRCFYLSLSFICAPVLARVLVFQSWFWFGNFEQMRLHTLYIFTLPDETVRKMYRMKKKHFVPLLMYEKHK